MLFSIKGIFFFTELIQNSGYKVADETQGIYISNVQLKIYYYETPSAPTNLQDKATTNGCALSWTKSAVGPAKTYHVQYKKANESTWTDANPDESGTSKTLSGLASGTPYNWRVKSINPAGESVYSSTGSFTTEVIPPSISGSTPICYGSPKSFSASNWDQGNYYWEASNGLVIFSCSTCPTTNVSANGSGDGWVSIKNSNHVELAQFRIYVGTPLHTDFYANIMESIKPPRQIIGQAIWDESDDLYLPGTYPVSEFLWSFSAYGWSVTQQKNPQGISFGRVEMIPPYTGAEAEVYVSAKNICGLGGINYAGTIGSMSSPAITYPNPATNTLTIEIVQETISQAKSLEQTVTDAKVIKQDPTYDLRLYDAQSNLLRQSFTKGGTVQFNVSNLLNGIYYLHIYDGISEKPEIRQIMVEH